MTLCVTLCYNTAKLVCGLTSNSYAAVNAVDMDDIKVELSLYCSSRSLKS